MNEAETRRREICDSSLMHTDAQSCAQLESPCTRVPYIAGCDSSLSPVLRPDAPQWKRTRSLAAYGYRPSLILKIATIV